MATTEAEREAWRRAWGQSPLAIHTGRCPTCGRRYGVIDGVLNAHDGKWPGPLRCKGGTPTEVQPC